MMSADEVFDYFRQIVFVCQFQPVCHVTDHDLSTLFVIQILMRIDSSRLVFCKEGRILHLANIMI